MKVNGIEHKLEVIKGNSTNFPRSSTGVNIIESVLRELSQAMTVLQVNQFPYPVQSPDELRTKKASLVHLAESLHNGAFRWRDGMLIKVKMHNPTN